MQELTEIAALSRQFGADTDFVFLGGGNTSFKTAETLHIKPSGTTLATIAPDQFIALERASLQRVFTEPLPEDTWEREAVVKELLLSAVCPTGQGRPSVESPVHEIIDYSYVFHLHPTLVNGMTCARNGQAVCAELFPDALWIEFVNPGYTLSTVFRERLAEAARERGQQPKVTFLQNHGVFVGATSLDEIQAIYTDIVQRLHQRYDTAGVSVTLATKAVDHAAVAVHAPPLRTWLGAPNARAIVHASGYFQVAEGPLSPDHIVYARSFPYQGDITAEGIAGFASERGYNPKILSCPQRAVFTADSSLKGARETMLVARDAALVRQLSQAFGGPRFLAASEHGFIENWEVESYRKQVAKASEAAPARLNNRICVVTGAAQGFGLGIAQALAEEGGIVVLADMNLEGAQKAADDIVKQRGPGRASAVYVNITDENSVDAMVRDITAECGGVDLFVANAGVLRAGSVKDMSKGDWEFVTSVNYTGYFLCVKHVAPVMAAQAVDDDAPWCDIVQINSKSGLEGSNRNAAYAGSKFGTIGLTQSFAKELVEDRIKVNSICPGNFFDGPLWSDPERGLFVQYLNSGKVPGAETVDDVRRAYEQKVPMQRGCTPQDVTRAILYAVEQQYETGQAIPVTGGQVMLN